MRDDGRLEQEIEELLADARYNGHPLRDALDGLFDRYRDGLTQLERLTNISDGYQSVLRQRNETLATRYRKQIRQLHRIVKISDHYQEMMRETNEKLKIASTQDPLTGLPNRRLMLDRLNAEVALVRRRKQTFSVAIIDADHFKRVNDLYGHDVGDKALIFLARALTAHLRAYDVCSRWGGEEFLILLPETTGEVGAEIANRLRLGVANLHPEELPAELTLSISAGVAEFSPESSLEETIKRADDSLYEAKRNGRNRVVLASRFG